MARYRCLECGLTVTFEDDRERQKKSCPQCAARLPSKPVGTTLPMGLILGGALFSFIVVVGAVVLALTVITVPPQQQAQALANRPDAKQIFRPRGKDKDNFEPPKEERPKVNPFVPPPPPPPEPPKKEIIPFPPMPVDPLPKPPEPPARQTFKMPATPHRPSTKPVTLTERTKIPLPESTSRVVVGGDGRVLVLRFSKLRKIAVFDMNTLEVIRYIDIGDDQPLFAAGMRKLAVYLPSKKSLVRYDLLSGEKELTKEIAATNVKAMAMGYASAGPVALATEAGGFLYDLETLAEIPPPLEERPDQFGALRPAPRFPFSGDRLEASGNGRVFVGNGQFQAGLLQIEGNRLKPSTRFGTSWMFARPNEDGDYVFRGGTGASTVEGQRTQRVVYSNPDGNAFAGYFFMPAINGPFYFHIHFGDGLRGHEPRFQRDPDRAISVYKYGHDNPIARLTSINEVPNWRDMGQTKVPFHERFHMLPRHHVLVAVDGTGSYLQLIPFNPYQALDEAKIDYLEVASLAPGVFVPGKVFRYPLRVRSRAGNVQYKLDHGPNGMAIGADGVVAWAVPATFANDEVNVVVSLKDDSDRQQYHTFRLIKSDDSPEYLPEPEGPKTVALPKAKNIDRIPYRLPDIPPMPDIPLSEVTTSRSVAVKQKWTAMYPGGGGRYLVLHAKEARLAFIIDVCSGNVERQIELNDDQAVIAVGMHHVFVYRDTINTIEKYNLSTGASEGRKVVPSTKVTEMLIGSAANGPLLVRSGRDAELYDTASLQPMELPKNPAETPFPFEAGPMWVSANGRLFSNVARPAAGPIIRSALLEEQGIIVKSTNTPAEYAIPRHDGSALFVAGHGACNPSFNRLEGTGIPIVLLPLDKPAEPTLLLNPAVNDAHFVQIHLGDAPQLKSTTKAPANGITVFFQDSFRAVTTVEIADFTATNFKPEQLPSYVHFFPRANLLTYAIPGKNVLMLQPVKLKTNTVPVGPKPKVPNPPRMVPEVNAKIRWTIPEVQPIAHKPTLLTKETMLSLPSKILHIERAGGGRYLVCRTKETQLVVVDLLDAKVLYTLDTVLPIRSYTAGRSKIIILHDSPAPSELTRYDLITGKKERTIPHPLPDRNLIVAMGHASEGPILVGGANGAVLLDQDELKVLEIPGKSDFPFYNLSEAKVSVTPDGRTWALYPSKHIGAGAIAIVTLTPTELKLAQLRNVNASYISLAADGKTIFLGGQGAYTTFNLSPTAILGRPTLTTTAKNTLNFVPAVDSLHYVHVHVGTRNSLSAYQNDPLFGLSIHRLGFDPALKRLPNYLGEARENTAPFGDIGFPNSVHLLATAKLLASVDVEQKAIRLLPLDFDQLGPDPTVPKDMLTVPWKMPTAPKNIFQPLPLKETATLKLPAAIKSHAVGGGGRYLVATADYKSLTVVDLFEQKIIQTIPLPQGTSHFAAGQSKIVVANLNNGVSQLHRYDLVSGKLEFSTPIAAPTTLLLLGGASEGPVLVGQTYPTVHDLNTFRPMIPPQGNTLRAVNLRNRVGVAAMNGRSFLFHGSTTDSQTVTALRIDDEGTYTRSHFNVAATEGRISNIGSHFYLSRVGVYRGDLTPATDMIQEFQPIGRQRDTFCLVPAVDAPVYARVHGAKSPITPEQTIGISIHKYGDAKPLATVPTLFGVKPAFLTSQGGFDVVLEPFIFLPTAKCIVTIANAERTELLFHPLVMDNLPDNLPIPAPPPKVEPKPVPPDAPMTLAPYKLQPLPEPLPIKPVIKESTYTFTERLMINPPPILVAGGGRFLLLQRSPNKLDVFDLDERTVVRQLSLPTDHMGWVAGNTKVFVYDRGGQTIRRLSILTGKEEANKVYPTQAVPVAMGAATDGPVLAHVGSKFFLIDGETLEPMALPEPNFVMQELVNRPIRAAMDGRTFAVALTTGAGPIGGPMAGTQIMTLTPKGLDKTGGPFPSLYNIPASDGKHAFVAPHGILDYRLQTVTDTVRSATPTPREPPIHFYLPATDGPFYLKYHLPPTAVPGPPLPKALSDGTGVSIFAYGQSKPLLNLPNVNPLPERLQSFEMTSRLPDLLHMIPRAKAIVVVSWNAATIQVLPFDPESDTVQVPWVTSAPPRTFKVGLPLRYPLKVAGKAVGLKYWLEQAAPNMEISPDGLFTWTPAVDAATDQRVTIRIKDGKGNETQHSFILTKE